MKWQILAKRFIEHEVTLTLRWKLLMGWVKVLNDTWRLGVSARWIRKTEERANAIRLRDLAFVEDPVGYKIELT